MIFFERKLKFQKAWLTLFALWIFLLSNDKADAQTDTLESEQLITVVRIPNTLHGRMFLLDSNTTQFISKRDYQFLNYTGLSDILAASTPFYPLSLGSYMLFNHFFADGSLPNSISFASNGRSLISPSFGAYNLEQYAPEFLESIEIFTGSKAAIFGDNSPGAFLNIQEVRHNTNKPFTKLWIAQGGAEFLASDGIFSQNFHPEWNFTFGFRNANTDGRFSNNWMNLWNLRLLLRWSPSDSTSITFTEYFTNLGHGNSGGSNIFLEQDYYDPISTRPLFDGLNEREFRHDLNLTFTHIFPTSSTVSLTTYFSTSQNERFAGRNYDFRLGDTTFKHSKDDFNYYGVSGRYEQELFGFAKFKTGGFIDRRYISDSYINIENTSLSLAGFGHLELSVSDFAVLSGGIRLFTLYENIGTAIGVNLKLTPSIFHRFEFDLSRANRLPYPVEGLSLENEEHYALFADYKGSVGELLKLNIRLFGRRINNIIATKINFGALGTIESINFENAEFAELAGVFAMLDYNLSDAVTLQIRVWSYPYLSGEYKDKFPLFYGGIRAFYTYSPGKSILRAGLEFGISTGAKNFGYMPLTRSYYTSEYESGLNPQSLDAFLEIKIGTAYFKASFMNLLASNYEQVTLYPHLSRNFRMSLNWAFLE